jgi:PKD domain
MKLPIILIFALPLSLQTPHSQAADCTTACVDVYTQNGEIVIEARKGSGPSAAKVAKPKVAKPKVVTPKVVKPKVVVKPKAIAPIKKVVKKSVKKAVKKVVKKSAPKAVAATSLSDRLSKALPTGGISYQPDFKPLIHTPVYFWNDLPSVFRTQVNLIGESIDVVLRPSYTWSFGDGSFLSTTDPGGPYPNGKITHIYSQPGIYPVLLTTTWNGSFTHNAVERTITGEIKKVSALTITVVAAPTRFMN